MSETIHQIEASGGGTVLDQPGLNVITAGAQATTVTASQGTDTILGAAGLLLVDAGEDNSDVTVLAGSGPLDFIPGSGANSVSGADGKVTVEAGFQGFEGTLSFTGGSAAATVNGYIDTTVTGGTGAGGTVLFVQNGPATVIGGVGTVTVYTDGNQLTIGSPDGVTRHTTMPDTHVYMQVTEGPGGLSTVAVNGVDGTAGGVVDDDAGATWIQLGDAAATVVAALGTDTVEAGAGAATVDAVGNGNPIVVNAGTGALDVIPGGGTVQVVGGSGSLHVASGDTSGSGGSGWNWSGPAGDTVVLDHDGNGLVRLTDRITGAVYTFTPTGVLSGGATVTGGTQAAANLLAGERGNPFYSTLQQRLATLLGPATELAAFTVGQVVPQGPQAVPGLVIPAIMGGGIITVPGSVAVVNNAAAVVDLTGNGAANQFVTSSQPFTYDANGGSGVVLADDAQAGGRAGNDHIVLAPSGGGDFLVATGSGDDTIAASSGDDTVAAGGGSNTLYLGSGADVVDASGMDTVISGAGAVTVDATAGLQTLVFGGPGTLSFVGGAGASTVVAGTGRPDLTAGAGDAVFWGSASGFATMHGGSGGSTLVGGAAGNVILGGGPANHLMVAGTGGSTILGGNGTGENMYWGSQGSDFIQTDLGHDTVIGGPGQDTVHAGGGTALIFGGADGDTFIAGVAAQQTEIIAGGGAPSNFVFVKGQAGGNELIWGFRPGTDHLTLQGYASGELDGALATQYGYGLGRGISLSDGTTIAFGDLSQLTRATFA